ncbi:NYN domain-containing protein, partial [Pavlovales sp. CCMP2436]
MRAPAAILLSLAAMRPSARTLYSSRAQVTVAANARGQVFAVLVDAENAKYSALSLIMKELATLGAIVTVRRIYGNFSKPNLAPWREVALANSFRPVNAFSFVSGKGTSDAIMIIEAMDCLYTTPNLDGFALVTSDSDFTPLAQRLREAGRKVIGFGSRQTPSPFVTACEHFIYTENL